MPKEIKNLERTAKRIIKAVKKKENIILYGDADLDGLAAVVIMKESIRSLGGKIKAVYFPERQKEGYGLNLFALKYLKKYAPALLILLACGISNFEEAQKAKKFGFELIIIDHHEVIDKLPEASIIVAPKQKGDRYPFKQLATAGIVFRLSRLFFGRKFSPKLRQSLLELAALATIADLMPQKHDNRIIVKKGLASLRKTLRPGLKVFWKMKDISPYSSTGEIAQKIISSLNFSEVKNHLIEAYSLLSATDERTARIISESILEKNYFRHLKVKEIVEETALRNSANVGSPIVFEGASNWEAILLGSAASKICHKFNKPTFILRKGKQETRGAVRMPKNLDGIEAMKTCAKYLITFGGHPAAAGFTIKNKNLEKFKLCLVKYFHEI